MLPSELRRPTIRVIDGTGDAEAELARWPETADLSVMGQGGFGIHPPSDPARSIDFNLEPAP